MQMRKMTKLTLLTMNESTGEPAFLYEINLIGVRNLVEDVKKTIGLDLIEEAGFKKDTICAFEKLRTPLISEKTFKLKDLPESVRSMLQFDGNDKKIWDIIDKKESDGYLAFGVFSGMVVDVKNDKK